MAWDFLGGFMGGDKKPWLESIDPAEKLSGGFDKADFSNVEFNKSDFSDVSFDKAPANALGQMEGGMAQIGGNIPDTPMGQSKAGVAGAGGGFDWKGLSNDLTSAVSQIKENQLPAMKPLEVTPLMRGTGGGAISPAPAQPALAAPSMSGALTAITGGMQDQNFLEMLRRMR